ncbi:hypothetical protein BUALT_Bualt19G0121400 [Buddleja alternifolia]|uniref:RRM domain-containing protein n=1 Tax=Buddleja alternifolia TaxID=168488 RepID=A0AAV6WAK5_9LAMI|nr:hypothetical protein BUALT_Bualt19G0121400 [Buddleja alternifolia]
MSPPTTTFPTLNPFAPEYNPIPPGVTPQPHAPPPFPFPPPSSAAFHQPFTNPSSFPLLQPPPPPPPPPNFSSTQIITCTPYNYTTNYYITPQNQSTATNPPPPPPQPETAAVSAWQPRRGCPGQGRGFRAGGRGRGNSCWSSSRDERNGLGFCNNLKNEMRTNNFNDKNSKFPSIWSMQKKGIKTHDKVVVHLKRDEDKTTVMIKNIPYDCPRKELINILDGFCSIENAKARNIEGTSQEGAEEHIISAYDFLYLPIDFRTKNSRGFAFVNFTNTRTVWKFFDAFHLQKWEVVEWDKWPKKIEIVCAKIQGKEALVNHFSQSTFECETDEFLPVSFNPPRDGSGQSVQLTVIGNRRAASRSGTRQ